MVKHLTVSAYTAVAHTLPGVVLSGDFVRVDCDEAGAFMMIDEEEYKILRDSFEMLLAANAAGLLQREILEQWERLTDH